MTSQVSNVTVNGQRMRRLTMVHGLLSFGFDQVALAMTVNVFPRAGRDQRHEKFVTCP